MHQITLAHLCQYDELIFRVEMPTGNNNEKIYRKVYTDIGNVETIFQ